MSNTSVEIDDHMNRIARKCLSFLRESLSPVQREHIQVTPVTIEKNNRIECAVYSAGGDTENSDSLLHDKGLLLRYRELWVQGEVYRRFVLSEMDLVVKDIYDERKSELSLHFHQVSIGDVSNSRFHYHLTPCPVFAVDSHIMANLCDTRPLTMRRFEDAMYLFFDYLTKDVIRRI